MESLRCVGCLISVYRRPSRCILLLVFICLLSFLIFFAVTLQTATEDFTLDNHTRQTTRDFKEAILESNGFLAATKTNRGQTSPGISACVVDPAITDCTKIGLAAFLLRTLDLIIFCRILGSKNAVVFWRACDSVCSRNPRVNSWDWYFEPVNPGLEAQAEKVLCPLVVDDMGGLYNNPIWNNGFKDRSGVEGFEENRIITTKERMRVNRLIRQYVKPNSRITEKVNLFYHRHLAGYTVLGVHVRGTDHWRETKEKRLPPLMSWVESAKTIFETLPLPRKLFIASDNDEVIDKFVAFFGKEKVSSTTG